MYEVLNTLYLVSDDLYAHLDHEAVVVRRNDRKERAIPLRKLQAIVVFGTASISAGLVRACGEAGRSIVWLSRSGRYANATADLLAGGVFLRIAQHRSYSDPLFRVAYAQDIISAKLETSERLLRRWARDRHGERAVKLASTAMSIERIRSTLPSMPDVPTLMGCEGRAARIYFAGLPEALADDGWMAGRTRRPPLDPFNAMISFGYTLLAAEARTALMTVGLDPYVGFMHSVRPGRPALALDLMEDQRASRVDRLAVTLVNRRQVRREEHFETGLGGDVRLNETGRKIWLGAWEEDKRRLIIHPTLRREIPVGLVSHLQSRLLARRLRENFTEWRSVPLEEDGS